MRKILLLSASGLALGVLGSGSAFADDPVKVTLSGTGQEWFTYANNDTGDVGRHADFSSQSNNDFALNGSTKLDNGITVSVSFTMNASAGAEGSNAWYSTSSGHLSPNNVSYTNSTGSPETNYVGFSGSFGQVNIGWQSNAAVAAIQDAPYLGVMGLSWDRWGGFVVAPSSSNLVQGGETATFDDYWANKVVYTSPVFAGFQVSASFTPNMAGQDDFAGNVATSAAATGNWGGNSESAALSYSGDFGASKIKAVAAWTGESFNGQLNSGSQGYTGISSGQGGHLNGYSGSLQWTAGGFTVGGAMNYRDASKMGLTGTAAYSLQSMLGQGLTWDLGAEYKTGPWGIAVNYFTSSSDDNLNTLNASGTAQDQFFGAELEYALGPGITLDWENGYIDYKVSGGTNQTSENHGVVSTLSTTVNF